MAREGGEPPCPSAAALPTPTLAAERRRLHDRIYTEGGFAYVAVADQVAAGDARTAEAAREMAWEQLHSGPWHSVRPVWRDAYAMACLSIAGFHLADGARREALRALDMGLIMGGLLLRDDLSAAIDWIRRPEVEGAEAVGLRDTGWSDGSAASDEAQVLPVLPSKSLLCSIVERRSSLKLESFLRDYVLANRPVIITDCMSHWPAITKWKDVDYLKRVAGDWTVPVEVGKNYLSQEWKQELISFSHFLERIRSSDFNTTYLAQHPLFDQIHELRNDILIPDYCFSGGGELQSLIAWFGPSGTVTPLHHDLHHNLFAQVDLDNLNEKAFPRFSELEFVDCILEEGEMLYIPPNWWHYVRSISISFSMPGCLFLCINKWCGSRDKGVSHVGNESSLDYYIFATAAAPPSLCN